MEEVRALGVWCQENNLSLNINKGDDCGLQETTEGVPPCPHRWDSSGAVEKVESFKFTSRITSQCGEEGATASLQPQEAE
jgi:hypothetical protein